MSGDVRFGVEVVDLAGDANRVVGRVERADRADAAVPVDAPVPERVLPDAVGGDDSDAGDDYPAHDATPIGRPTIVLWSGLVALVVAPRLPAGIVRRAGRPVIGRPRA